LSISQLAESLEISPRSIRFYEEKGLIAPGRTAGNQRFYTRRDRARLKLILRGKRFGYRLEEISRMIGLTDSEPDEGEQIRQSLAYGEAKLREIRERMAELRVLESDMRAVRRKLRRRLAQLQAGEVQRV
jgi:DNA-binding transcriptional MerR regulator